MILTENKCSTNRRWAYYKLLFWWDFFYNRGFSQAFPETKNSTPTVRCCCDDGPGGWCNLCSSSLCWMQELMDCYMILAVRPVWDAQHFHQSDSRYCSVLHSEFQSRIRLLYLNWIFKSTSPKNQPHSLNGRKEQRIARFMIFAFEATSGEKDSHKTWTRAFCARDSQ